MVVVGVNVAHIVVVTVIVNILVVVAFIVVAIVIVTVVVVAAASSNVGIIENIFSTKLYNESVIFEIATGYGLWHFHQSLLTGSLALTS